MTRATPLTFALLGALLLAIAPGCRDRHADLDGDGGPDEPEGPCEELYAAFQAAIDAACDVFPDCSICEQEIDTDEQPSEEDCLELLDSWDHDAMVELYLMMCEMEADAVGNDW